MQLTEGHHMITLVGLVIGLVVGAVVEIGVARTAPLGYQNATGFNYGVE